MLAVRISAATLAWALLATLAMSQSGDADPPSAGTVPGSGDTRKPQTILTLEQKRKLQVFCQDKANKKDARCVALKDSLSAGAAPGSQAAAD